MRPTLWLASLNHQSLTELHLWRRLRGEILGSKGTKGLREVKGLVLDINRLYAHFQDNSPVKCRLTDTISSASEETLKNSSHFQSASKRKRKLHQWHLCSEIYFSLMYTSIQARIISQAQATQNMSHPTAGNQKHSLLPDKIPKIPK